MKNKILTILNKSFVRNVATVASGTAAVQVIAIIFSPIITRLYGPESFGILGVFLSIVAIISPIATLTYSTAIVLPEEKEEAFELVHLSIIVVLFISFLTAIGVLIFYFIPEDVNGNSIRAYIILIPIVILFAGITQILNQWFIRTQNYKNMAILSVAQSLSVNVSKIGIGFINATASVLILISVLGHVIHSLLFFWKVDNDFKTFIKKLKLFRKKVNVKIAQKYKDFPFYRAPQVLFNALTKSFPVLLLAYFFGPAAAGFYSIGNRILHMPAGIIGKSIGNVYYPRIAKAANNNENLKPYILKASIGMAGLVVIPFLIVILFGPVLFGFIFGNEWVTAGHYARWMAFMIFFEFILNPTKDAMIVMGFQKSLLLYEVISLIFKIFMLTIGFYFLENDIDSIILFSLGGSAISIGLIGWLILKSSKISRTV